ncbi:MAG: phosphate ABC transporter substrate-binding protein PstS [Acetobacteraceae bacterium]
MPHASRRALLGSLLTLTAAPALVAAPALAAGSVRLLETGSTLLYPLFNLWVAAYAAENPSVQIITQGTGSGTGISQAISGIAEIGATDAYMSTPQMRRNAGMLNIPLAISSQMVNYNLPGEHTAHLRFSGPVLSAIYSGKIKFWDDPRLARLNADVRLPHQAIIPLHRTDGSGDTFLFTQYLSASTPAWRDSVGYGTTVSWPAVPGGLGAEGTPGMVNAMKGTPYSIAYIGISFRKAIEQARLGEAMLENQAGKFVLPTARTVSSAVAAGSSKTPPDERLSLIFAPGDDSYPIINYEYAIVQGHQASQAVAEALRRFLTWCIDPNGGNASHFMRAVGFVPLPSSIAVLSQKQIARIR